MIITCSTCSTSFSLDDKMIKPTGSKVRCSVCAKVFTVYPQEEITPAPKAAEALQSETGPTVDADVPAAGPAEASAPSVVDDASLGEALDLDFDMDEETDVSLPTDSSSDDDLDLGLDEELTDIPLEAESTSDLDLSETGAIAADATLIASIDDDLDLDFSPTAPDAEDGATMIADLDADALDLDLDDQPATDETMIVDLDEDELTLTAEDLPGSLEEDETTIVVDLDEDALELTLDLDAKETPAVVDMDSRATQKTSDTLDLDFDLELDDTTPPDEPAKETLTIDEDLTLTLDLEDGEVEAADTVAASPELSDDLDLSSLESLLSDDSAQEDAATMVIGDEEELDLSLDEEETPGLGLEAGDRLERADQPAGEAAASDLSLDDLSLDLDEEGEAADQEIDLSEIEKMLEEPQGGGTKFAAVPEQDLELDIEASLETEKWMAGSGDKEPVVVDEELDLSDLEQALEDVDLGAAEVTGEEPELELDLGDGEKLGAVDETMAVDNELEFDLSDFEEKSPAATAGVETGEMELDFELEENRQAEQTLEDEGLEATVAMAEAPAAAIKKAPSTPVAPPKPAVTPRPTAAQQPKPVKKGASKSVVILLVLLLLGIAGGAAIYFMNQSGIEIPFIGDYLKPKVQDPGNLKLKTYDINSKFIDNANVGKLFVISGMVKNEYAENRGMISLEGKLFSKDKAVVNQEKVYAGNIMSDLELANLEWDKIKARLANRLGDNRSNVKIEPGQSVAFMVVFSKLPNDLEEFTIEVLGSTSLK